MNKYGKALQSLLVKLRIFDGQTNDLSLTSILFMVAIGRLALFPADSFSVAVLTLAIAHSNAKKFSAHKRAKEENRNADQLVGEKNRIDELAEKVQGLIRTGNMNKLGR